MKNDPEKCIGCGNCVAVCPMEAIHVEGAYGKGIAHTDQDACVECGACLRFATPENLSPGISRLVRRVLAGFKLRYAQPIDICPTSAIYQPEISWPREIRKIFSDPTSVHTSTDVKGRGTEEIKTNDVTGRLKTGDCGILIEFGRPNIGAYFYEVQKMCMALAKLNKVRFEKKNPIFLLMADCDTGELRQDILQEKVLTCIVEVLTLVEDVPEVLAEIERVAKELDTVIALNINAKANDDGSIPYEEVIKQTSFMLSPNGKINLGLGRAIEAKDAG